MKNFKDENLYQAVLFSMDKIKIVLYFLIYKSYMKVNESGFKMKKKKTNNSLINILIRHPIYFVF